MSSDKEAPPKTTKKKKNGVKKDAIKELNTSYSCELDPSTHGQWLVPLGTGGAVNSWMKDNLYRQLINEKREEYIFLEETIPERDKRNIRKQQIAEGIVKHVHDMKGQFVEKIEGRWEQVADKKRLRQKTQQALREKAPMHRAAITEKRQLVERERREAELRSRQAEFAQFRFVNMYHQWQRNHSRYRYSSVDAAPVVLHPPPSPSIAPLDNALVTGVDYAAVDDHDENSVAGAQDTTDSTTTTTTKKTHGSSIMGDDASIIAPANFNWEQSL